jgi:hypothetical protein
MTRLPPELLTRRDHRHGSPLGDVLRRLILAIDSDAVAAVHAVRRVLESAGTDAHGLVDHLESTNGGAVNGEGISKEALKRAFDQGYSKGVEYAESRQHDGRDFRNTDGKLEWDAVALFLQRNKHQLDPRHHEFIVTWRRAPHGNASVSTDICIPCSTSWAETSREYANRRNRGARVHRDHQRTRQTSDQRY